MYDQHKTIRQAKHSYRRCRTLKWFILDADSPDRQKLTCVECGRLLSETGTDNELAGNRITYHPKTKKLSPMHYVCAWTGILGKLV